MKLQLASLRVLVLASSILLAAANPLRAQSFFFFGKSQDFFQTGSGALVADPTAPFGFGASTSIPITGLVMTAPNGAVYSLARPDNDGGYGYGRVFTTRAAMDAAFPNGTY